MSAEQGTNNNEEKSFSTKEAFLRKAEDLLNLRPTKLPKSIAAQIRQMKQDGRLSEAFRKRAIAFEDKSERRILKMLDDELGSSIVEIIENQDTLEAVDQIANMMKAIWLLDLGGYINSETRLDDLRGVLDKHPQVVEQLGGRLIEIRKEAEAIALRSR